MASSVVMKVKYGDTLRRFTENVYADQLVNLNMEGLRMKICSLFNFESDALLTLTYLDEDQDLVTLVDDEDLLDLLRQGLNPVRINVQLKTDQFGSSFARSTGSSTPSRSSEVHNGLLDIKVGLAKVFKSTEPLHKALSNLSLDKTGPSLARSSGTLTPNRTSETPITQPKNNGFAEVLESVPEPLREALLKLFLDITSNAASSSPILTELVDSIAKLGQSCLNPANTQPATSTRALNKSDEMPKGLSSEKGASKDDVDPTCNKSQEELGNKTRGMTSVHVKDLSDWSTLQKGAKSPNGDDKKKTKVIGDEFVGKCQDGYDLRKFEKIFSSAPRTCESTERKNSEFSGGAGDSSSPSFGWNPVNQCPFTGIPLEPSLSARHPAHPMGGIFHRGVRCDGCGVFPITGPRFKSKVKENYDLCSICFGQGGNDSDYIRINFPAPHRHPLIYGGLRDRMVHPPFWVPPPVVGPPSLRRGSAKKAWKAMHMAEPQCIRLDARFVMDVNVIDGTIMAPKTPFTKIWRVRNNGNDTWPCGTQLLWIGGGKFSEAESVEIQIPEGGVRVDEELDVAVDFVAPELPGEYTSYWRMASPSGHPFGQRLWALIEVEAFERDFSWEDLCNINLNLPPVNSGINPLVPPVNFEPLVDVGNGTAPPAAAANSEKPFIDVQQQGEERLQLNAPFLLPTAVETAVLDSAGGGSSRPNQVASSPVLYPGVDAGASAELLVDSPTLPSPLPIFPRPAADLSKVLTPSSELVGNIELNAEEGVLDRENNVEQTLMKELAEMGFTQMELNKEILRLNDYNLEQSVEDLCGFAEWDPLLEELQEMGFSDKEMNRRLLVKNNGSLKRVVMDLIAGADAE